MASFKTRIEDLVGSVGDDAFLTDALTDATAEIVNFLSPDNLSLITATTNDFTSNGKDLDSIKVLSVQRENGTDGEYVECRKVAPQMERKVSDVNSMFFATKETPVFFQREGKLYVYPSPAADPNATKAYYVVAPVVSSSTDDIGNFPNELIHVVVLGASVKAVQRLMADVKTLLSDVPTYSSSVITRPDAVSVSTVDYSDASASSASASSASAVSKADISGDVPGYTMPTISGEASAGASEITDTITAGAGLTDYFDWWNELGTMIETDEDIELAQTQLQKIRAYVEAYSQAMQNQLNEFNQENVRYQANIQAEIALHNSNLRKALQDAQQATAVALQNSQQTTAVSLQNKAKAMETAIANNESALSKHRSQTQEYQARVGEAIQKYSSDIQKYAADVQRYQAQYQWYAEQQKSLDSQYQRALQPFVNAPQPQKQ